MLVPVKFQANLPCQCRGVVLFLLRPAEYLFQYIDLLVFIIYLCREYRHLGSDIEVPHRDERSGRIVRPFFQSGNEMPGAVETAVNRHIIGFHEIPVTIEQTFLCRLVPDLVQSRLVHLTESDIRVVEHGEWNVRFTLTADDFFSVLALNEAGTHPVNRRVGSKQHSRGLECLMGPPAETGEQHFDSPLRDFRHLVHHGDGVFGRTETLEVGVAGNVRHLFHDDDRVVPECERAFEIVYLVVYVLFQSPVLQYRLDGVPCRFLQ